MLRAYKAEGIILKQNKIGEADKLITVFTKEYGKKIFTARGIRKLNSRKAPHLEILNLVSLYLAKGNRYDIIIEATATNNFPKIKEDLFTIFYVYKIIEVVDKFCQEQQMNKVIYFNLLDVFSQISRNKEKVDSLTQNFILQLVWELGFLERSRELRDIYLDNFLSEILENKLKSQILLTKLDNKL